MNRSPTKIATIYGVVLLLTLCRGFVERSGPRIAFEKRKNFGLLDLNFGRKSHGIPLKLGVNSDHSVLGENHRGHESNRKAPGKGSLNGSSATKNLSQTNFEEKSDQKLFCLSNFGQNSSAGQNELNLAAGQNISSCEQNDSSVNYSIQGREGGHLWITPSVGEAETSITIMDCETKIPTAVNFSGPYPKDVEIFPPSENKPNLSHSDFVSLFRGSASYLRMHRGATFVIHISGEVVASEYFRQLMEDLGLLSLLGIFLVLVVDSKPQAHDIIERSNLKQKFSGEHMIIDHNLLKAYKEATGYVRFEVERSLTRGQRGADTISVAGGNFYSAQPLGVRDGIDYGFMGEVRKIETAKIRSRLDSSDIVQLNCLGFSSSGEVFLVDTERLASETAAQLKAEKLIYVSEGQRIIDRSTNKSVQTLRLREARKIISFFSNSNSSETRKHHMKKMLEMLSQSVRALSKGVQRAHIVEPTNGALLKELFTRDGSGLLISRDIYDGIRPACSSDIPGISEIIRPLERAGILVERSEAKLEHELRNFFVFTRDGATVACAYLKRFSECSAELGCLAVHPKYRRGGRGEAMLGYLERVAILNGISSIFVLSTRTMEWFVERGFEQCSVDDLPDARRDIYDWKRKSKVYRKKLDGTRAVDAEELFWDIAT